MLVVYGTADLVLLIVLMSSRILLLKAAKGVELRCSWLERTTDE